MSWKCLLCCALLSFTFQQICACTGIVRKAENGDWVYARTLEFGADLLTFNLTLVPREIDYSAQMSDDKQGMKWTTKYGHVGFSPFGLSLLADGINEKGLACGAFYLPGWAKYEETDSPQSSKTISNLDFVSWVLGNFTTVEEVIEALKQVKVTGVVLKEWGIVPPLHYMVVDQNGNQIVVEYVDGKQNIYKQPLSTITNSPGYDWHMTNARNYIGLRTLNEPSIKIDGSELSSFGQGSGARGLPGDFTPPSRFIRAGFLRQVVVPGKNGLEEIKIAFKILNQFDIPRGAVREVSNGKTIYEETQWTSASDLASRRYFFHTYASRVIRSVDLKKLDLNSKEIKSIAVDTPESIVEISSVFTHRQ